MRVELSRHRWRHVTLRGQGHDLDMNRKICTYNLKTYKMYSSKKQDLILPHASDAYDDTMQINITVIWIMQLK